jgi:Fe-S-cluster containining protein
MNKWKEYLGVAYPECKMTGHCCRYASPSFPALKLLKKAAEGSQFARDFFNIFVPYDSIEEVRLKVPQLVEKVLAQADKSSIFDTVDQVVFFKCSFLADDNKCMVYEDRPELCRSFPDTPFLVIAPGCAFEGWSKDCKEKYKRMNEDLKYLKNLKDILSQLDKNITIPASKFKYTSFIISPAASWLK